MAAIHQINCAANRRNTGFGGCPVDWKLITGVFLFDQPQVFSAQQLATLQQTLQAMAISDVKSTRCYPVANLLNPVDNSEDPVIQTFADGSKAKVRDGVYDWKFQITAGGFCLLEALQTHNSNGGTYALFYDKQFKILATNNNGKLAAIPLQIFDAENWKMNNGQVTAAYILHFVFSSTYVNESAEYTAAGFDPSTIVGLQDIKFIVNGFNQATGLANISIITECGGANMYSQYSTDFTASVFVATNAETGASIPVTTVTPIPGNQTFNVQLNRGSANWPADGNVFLTTVPPSGLTAAGIPGYEVEGVSLEVTSS